MEHKVLAHMQARLGPMEAGRFHGWAQLVADGVKFVQKEDVVPAAADRWSSPWRPAVAMVPYIAIFVVIPFSDRSARENLDIGIFFVLAMSSVSVIGVLMAGWASANKFSLIGALRAAAQLIAYELPLILAAAAVVMQASTLSLVGIVEAQQPVLVHRCTPARDVRDLHDLGARRAHPAAVRHADRRLGDHLRRLHRVHGPEVRVLPAGRVRGDRGASPGSRACSSSGAIKALPASPFSRARSGCSAKIGALSFFVIWLRATYPRLREDQLQRFAWLVLIPLSLAESWSRPW